MLHLVCFLFVFFFRLCCFCYFFFFCVFFWCLQQKKKGQKNKLKQKTKKNTNETKGTKQSAIQAIAESPHTINGKSIDACPETSGGRKQQYQPPANHYYSNIAQIQAMQGSSNSPFLFLFFQFSFFCRCVSFFFCVAILRPIFVATKFF